jgi:hypothetical protein
MFLRIFSIIIVLGLAGCGQSSENPVTTANATDRIACATGDNALVMDCAMERDGAMITVRHRDGSFRRFEVDANGQFGSADGADEVTGSRREDGTIDVRLSDIHYRFATDQLQP